MLKNARTDAGLSREVAALRLHIGARTLSNYENGQSMVPQEIILKMAEVYRKPDLPAKYCSKLCPIGQVYAYWCERDDVATTVLGLLKEFEDVARLRNKLIAIAADGQIDEAERPEFKEIMREVCGLERAIGEVKLVAARLGIDIAGIIKKEKEPTQRPAVKINYA